MGSHCLEAWFQFQYHTKSRGEFESKLLRSHDSGASCSGLGVALTCGQRSLAFPDQHFDSGSHQHFEFVEPFGNCGQCHLRLPNNKSSDHTATNFTLVPEQGQQLPRLHQAVPLDQLIVDLLHQLNRSAMKIDYSIIYR